MAPRTAVSAACTDAAACTVPRSSGCAARPPRRSRRRLQLVRNCDHTSAGSSGGPSRNWAACVSSWAISTVPRRRSWRLAKRAGIRSRDSRWCDWLAATSRWPRHPSGTPWTVPGPSRPRSCPRTPTCAGPPCSPLRSRSKWPPETSSLPATPPTNLPGWPQRSRARRWWPARPWQTDACDSPPTTRRGRGRRSRLPSSCGASSGPRTRPRWPERASPRQTGSLGLTSVPTREPVATRQVDERQREPNVFHQQGDYWSVSFEGHTVAVRDLKGLHYLARLLADPGREFHVLDLVASGGDPAASTAVTTDPELTPSDWGDSGPLLDAHAKSAYRRRLAEIEEDLDEARLTRDDGRAAQAEAERDFLIRELSRAVGLEGVTDGPAPHRNAPESASPARSATPSAGSVSTTRHWESTSTEPSAQGPTASTCRTQGSPPPGRADGAPTTLSALPLSRGDGTPARSPDMP